MNDKTDLSAIKDEAFREPVVCAYACVPTWPTNAAPPGISDFATTLPSSSLPEVDIDKVQEIVSDIKRNKEKLYDLENLLLSPNDTIIVESFDNVNHELIFDIPYDTEVAKGIIELIKSYYENEIERLNEELITVVVG